MMLTQESQFIVLDNILIKLNRSESNPKQWRPSWKSSGKNYMVPKETYS